MQPFLGDPESWYLDLESHCLALATAKKTLDKNRFKHAQKNTDHNPPNFKVSDRVYFKNKQPGKWDLKWRAGYRIVSIECNRHCIHVENQATGKTGPCNVKDNLQELPVELWNIDTKLGRAGKFINHQSNLPTIPPKHRLGSCSKLVISVIEHLVEVVDKLSTTAVVFFRVWKDPEAACTKLSQQDADKLRAEVNRVLRSSHPPNPN